METKETKLDKIEVIYELLVIYKDINRTEDFEIYWEMQKKIVELIKAI